ncbi:protein, SNF2 family [Teladorsagia circumcincta]|uniref:Protein, SNF2 family n=1 Tax=Teladorsagia circumcincta TaxID=45464 RepID=A0A2G9UMW4_TELCI|nr:protein, SNF2 family [Teladorsagia circumcincta]
MKTVAERRSDFGDSLTVIKGLNPTAGLVEEKVADGFQRKIFLYSTFPPAQTLVSSLRYANRTNFDNSLLLSQPALDAQRKEKERLERLERQKQSLGENGHIEQVAAMMPKPVTPLPVLDAFDPEVICLIGDDSDPGLDSKKKIPPLIRNAPKAEPEVIELSSGDEDEKYDGRASSSFTPYRVVPPLPSGFDYEFHCICRYDNIVESLSEFKSSPGFGCILAHSMGLGKTIQVITFIEVFLRVTEAKKVLVIVPINTIQNWYNEFEKWIPRYSEKGELCRQFEVFLLGDSVKTFDQRPPQPERTVKPDDFDQGFTADGRVKKEANDIIRSALIDPGADLVVCDEGHKIKNLNTDIALALGAIKTSLSKLGIIEELTIYSRPFSQKIWNHPDILAKTLERKREERRRTAQQKEANDQASDRISSYSQRDQVHNMTSASTWQSQSYEGSGYPSSASYGQEMTEPKRADESPRSSSKMRRSTRLKPKTIQGVMEEEFDITENDQGLQYDWAEVAMASYKTGNIEHGYKMVIAMELLDACVRIGEKMLIFRTGWRNTGIGKREVDKSLQLGS